MIIKQTREYSNWYKRLKDRQARARIDVRTDRLLLGNPGQVNNVGNGISELKINYGPGYRIYYKMTGKEIILLLIGGSKSTQEKDIKLAKALAKTL